MPQSYNTKFHVISVGDDPGDEQSFGVFDTFLEALKCSFKDTYHTSNRNGIQSLNYPHKLWWWDGQISSLFIIGVEHPNVPTYRKDIQPLLLARS